MADRWAIDAGQRRMGCLIRDGEDGVRQCWASDLDPMDEGDSCWIGQVAWLGRSCWPGVEDADLVGGWMRLAGASGCAADGLVVMGAAGLARSRIWEREGRIGKLVEEDGELLESVIVGDGADGGRHGRRWVWKGRSWQATDGWADGACVWWWRRRDLLVTSGSGLGRRDGRL
ncbi:hypothetical protein ACLOJK_037790 [Asimina triloba]